jgi:nucleoside 2-deoxyribosyltransferase
MKVYLAGPIFGRIDSQCKDWREWFIANSGVECLNPMCRDYRGMENANVAQIVELDKQDIDECEVVLVMYDKPSVGTSMEVIYAWERKKPVIVINNSDQLTLSPWLVYHSKKIVKTLQEAVEAIKSIEGHQLDGVDRRQVLGRE